jgi:hypothetical protein
LAIPLLFSRRIRTENSAAQEQAEPSEFVREFLMGALMPFTAADANAHHIPNEVRGFAGSRSRFYRDMTSQARLG